MQPEHGNYHHDHGKISHSSTYKDNYPPTNPESRYGSDGDETHGYGESVDGTWYPVMGSKSAFAAAFSRLRALPNASQSFVCSCLKNHAAIYSTATDPRVLTKTATVTSTDEEYVSSIIFNILPELSLLSVYHWFQLPQLMKDGLRLPLQ